MADRIAAIRKLLDKDPQDVFLHYSLAMEFASRGKHLEAVECLRQCIALDRGYLPAYVEAGKCLRSASKHEEAREMLRQGLALAMEKGEHHTASYIRQQIEALPPPAGT